MDLQVVYSEAQPTTHSLPRQQGHGFVSVSESTLETGKCRIVYVESKVRTKRNPFVIHSWIASDFQISLSGVRTGKARPYKIEQTSTSTTDIELNLKHGKSVRHFTMEVVSNSDFTDVGHLPRSRTKLSKPRIVLNSRIVTGRIRTFDPNLYRRESRFTNTERIE